jgi:transposase
LRDFSGFDSFVVAKTRRNDRMAWTEITRRKYQRDGLRYASDTADKEWRVIEPHLPPPARCGRKACHGAERPRRWVVEHTFAWLNRNRRLAKDVEATIESAVTWLYIASVKLMSRRLAAA